MKDTLTRIGIFYDGNFFSIVSDYYAYHHQKKARISIQGLHEFVRQRVAHEEHVDSRYCQVVEVHYFRGRFAAEETPCAGKLLPERRFDDVLVREGVTTHYLQMGCHGTEKGIDFVVELGPEAAAAGARITLEAKDRQGGDLKSALEDVRTARDNRQAQVGIFIYSRAAAPEGMEPFERYGNDMVVIWNPEDVSTDAYLKAALSLARFMVIAEAHGDESKTADFAEIERAIERIVKDHQRVDEIIKSATTIQNDGRKIRDNAERIQGDLKKQVDTLREHIDSLKGEDATALLKARA